MNVQVYVSATGGTGKQYTRKPFRAANVIQIAISHFRLGWHLMHTYPNGILIIIRPRDSRILVLEPAEVSNA